MKGGLNVGDAVEGQVSAVYSKSGAMLAEPLLNSVSPAVSLRSHSFE